MIVICRSNTGHVLPDDLLPLGGWSKDMEFNRLTVDSLYIVYGISVIKGYEWYLICEDGFDREAFKYPMYLPSFLFETANSLYSKYWEKKKSIDEYTGKDVINIGIPEILEDEYFYGNLLEDSQKEQKIFFQYKKLIDDEIVEQLQKIS